MCWWSPNRFLPFVVKTVSANGIFIILLNFIILMLALTCLLFEMTWTGLKHCITNNESNVCHILTLFHIVHTSNRCLMFGMKTHCDVTLRICAFEWKQKKNIITMTPIIWVIIRRHSKRLWAVSMDNWVVMDKN